MDLEDEVALSRSSSRGNWRGNADSPSGGTVFPYGRSAGCPRHCTAKQRRLTSLRHDLPHGREYVRHH